MATCPKCGFEQDRSSECLRCGVIFDRYRPSEEPPPAPEPLEETEEKSAPGAFIRFYRVFRWVVLAGAALVLFLIPGILTYRIAADETEGSVVPDQRVRNHMYPWLYRPRQGRAEEISLQWEGRTVSFRGTNALFARFHLSL